MQKFVIDSEIPDLNLDYEKRTTTLLTATIFYQVSGTRLAIDQFKRLLSDTIAVYGGIP